MQAVPCRLGLGHSRHTSGCLPRPVHRAGCRPTSNRRPDRPQTDGPRTQRHTTIVTLSLQGHGVGESTSDILTAVYLNGHVPRRQVAMMSGRDPSVPHVDVREMFPNHANVGVAKVQSDGLCALVKCLTHGPSYPHY